MKQGVSRGFCSTCLARLNRYARFEYVHAEKELSVVVDERKKVREDDDDEGGGRGGKREGGKNG